jgi:hypothetical protein
LKPEWWGSPLAQEEKYQGRKKTCDKKLLLLLYRIIPKLLSAAFSLSIPQ